MKSRALRGASVQAGSPRRTPSGRVCQGGLSLAGSAFPGRDAPAQSPVRKENDHVFQTCRSVDEGLPGVRQEQQAGGDRMRGVRCRPGCRSAGPRRAHGACGARCPRGSQLAGCACGSRCAEASRRLACRRAARLRRNMAEDRPSSDLETSMPTPMVRASCWKKASRHDQRHRRPVRNQANWLLRTEHRRGRRAVARSVGRRALHRLGHQRTCQLRIPRRTDRHSVTLRVGPAGRHAA